MTRAEINKMLADEVTQKNPRRGSINHVIEAPAEIHEILQPYDLEGAPLVEQTEAIVAAAWLTALNQAAARRDAAARENMIAA